jgi:ubiquitin-protein ligase
MSTTKRSPTKRQKVTNGSTNNEITITNTDDNILDVESIIETSTSNTTTTNNNNDDEVQLLSPTCTTCKKSINNPSTLIGCGHIVHIPTCCIKPTKTSKVLLCPSCKIPISWKDLAKAISKRSEYLLLGNSIQGEIIPKTVLAAIQAVEIIRKTPTVTTSKRGGTRAATAAAAAAATKRSSLRRGKKNTSTTTSSSSTAPKTHPAGIGYGGSNGPSGPSLSEIKRTQTEQAANDAAMKSKLVQFLTELRFLLQHFKNTTKTTTATTTTSSVAIDDVIITTIPPHPAYGCALESIIRREGGILSILSSYLLNGSIDDIASRWSTLYETIVNICEEFASCDALVPLMLVGGNGSEDNTTLESSTTTLHTLAESLSIIIEASSLMEDAPPFSEIRTRCLNARDTCLVQAGNHPHLASRASELTKAVKATRGYIRQLSEQAIKLASSPDASKATLEKAYTDCLGPLQFREISLLDLVSMGVMSHIFVSKNPHTGKLHVGEQHQQYYMYNPVIAPPHSHHHPVVPNGSFGGGISFQMLNNMLSPPSNGFFGFGMPNPMFGGVPMAGAGIGGASLASTVVYGNSTSNNSSSAAAAASSNSSTSNIPTTTAWSKAKLSRVHKELASLRSSLPLNWSSSVFCVVDEQRPDVLSFLIVGPDGTPYSNGVFVFDCFLGDNFPETAPKVKIQTTGGGKVRFNPNLYSDGKVCLSLLGTWSGPGWEPKTSTILQVLISISALIMVPDPYYNEPGYESLMNTSQGNLASKNYNIQIRKNCVQVAMIDQLKKPPYAFAQIVKQHFILKQREIKEQIETWAKDDPSLNRELGILMELIRQAEKPSLRNINGSKKKTTTTTTSTSSSSANNNNSSNNNGMDEVFIIDDDDGGVVGTSSSSSLAIAATTTTAGANMNHDVIELSSNDDDDDDDVFDDDDNGMGGDFDDDDDEEDEENDDYDSNSMDDDGFF